MAISIKKPKLKKLPKKPKGALSPQQLENYVSKVDAVKKENEQMMKEYNSALSKAKTAEKKVKDFKK
jgi:hypothetical protein